MLKKLIFENYIVIDKYLSDRFESQNRYYRKGDPLEEDEAQVKNLLDNLDQFKNINDLLKFAKESGLKLLGEGEGRIVYELPDSYNILKISKNKFGISQTKKESAIISNKDLQNITPQGLAYDFDGKWIIMEKVKILETEEEFEKYSEGVTFFDLQQILENYRDYDSEEELICNLFGREKTQEEIEKEIEETDEGVEIEKYECEQETLDFYLNNSLMKEIFNLISTTDMVIGDLLKIEQWGVTFSGKLVIVDTGFGNIYQRLMEKLIYSI